MNENPTTSEARDLRVVLAPPGDAADGVRRGALLKTLLDGGYPVTLAAEGESVAPLDASPLLVLQDEEGVGDRVDDAADGEVSVTWRGIAGLDETEVLDLVKTAASGQPEPGAWKPWFPVIDYDRCTNCMQCLSFCLFGVYDVDEEQTIDVAQPEKCKTNCPACSRVCPEVAILFPKYKNGPINGDVVQNVDVQREKMKTDITSLLGGDIYALLRERHQKASSRFSKERDEDRALKERQRCLKKLQAQFDIPDEVLQELPTAEAIQAKAKRRIEARTEPSGDAATSGDTTHPDQATDSQRGGTP